ncbi:MULTISPECIES: hypothetical protein [unclassified Streptomyces]|uniref:hypothetical protein n=1 Tax=unclassified Streptomyces TaxID=2593676 RepID=UPI0027E2E30E|nr:MULTISPECIES: hypothetical protein [unclassified Streptomyces]
MKEPTTEAARYSLERARAHPDSPLSRFRALPVPRILRALARVLDAGDEERAWRGTAAQSVVVERATWAGPGERFGSGRDLAAAWRAAMSGP